MKPKFPDLVTAEKLWHAVILNRLSKPYPFKDRDAYVFHTRGVARFAKIIAEKVPALDAQKAYVLGLLHDFGKRINEREENRFHAREGYEEMMALGYDDIARICLTHTFHIKDFSDDEYNYPADWLCWAKEKLAPLVYDDYDRLIQLCDMLTEGFNFVTIEQRADGIAGRYHLSARQKQNLIRDALPLKQHFDILCGEDVYALLQIKSK